ncbi:conserved exported hypothetical protein [Candidatus Terasakiella magnetica]|nr:conserved exported hypothetical protein [Candidatus Terasakiella magnetica]
MQQLWARGFRLAAICGLLALAAGCGDKLKGVPPSSTSWPLPDMEGMPPLPPVPPRTLALIIPPAIAGDPEAQRFALLKRLVEEGLDPPADADARRAANLGSLLPYSAPPPAAGLDHSIAVQAIGDRIAGLGQNPSGPEAAFSGERSFLLDSVLPLVPRVRAKPARNDLEAFKLGRERATALMEVGLIDDDERARELAAIGAAESVVSATPLPPPTPPAPVKKKAGGKKKTAGGETAKSGDVPGGVVPVNGKGPMGLHLLSMASANLTDKAVEALKKEYPELGGLEFKAVKTVIPDLGTTYRLLAGPVPAGEVEALCKSLRSKGQSCAASSF